MRLSKKTGILRYCLSLVTGLLLVETAAAQLNQGAIAGVVKDPTGVAIQTADTSAEFGKSAGGVVNASIKSGMNGFHGDVWECVRGNDLGQFAGILEESR